jgi:hypothetical protein
MIFLFMLCHYWSELHLTLNDTISMDSKDIITWTIVLGTFVFKRPVEIWWDERRERRKNRPLLSQEQKRSQAWLYFDFTFSFIFPVLAVAYHMLLMPLTKIIVLDIALMVTVFFFNLSFRLIASFKSLVLFRLSKQQDDIINLQDALLAHSKATREFIQTLNKGSGSSAEVAETLRELSDSVSEMTKRLENHPPFEGKKQDGQSSGSIK